MQLALLLFETTAALDPGEQVTVPRAEPDPSTVRVVRESLLYDGRRALGVLRRGVTGAVPAAARTVRDPVGALADVLATARSVGRFVQPVSGTLSNLMTAGASTVISTCSPSISRTCGGQPIRSGAP